MSTQHVICYLVICVCWSHSTVLSFLVSFHPSFFRYILCHLIQSLLSSCSCLIISSDISLYGLLPSCTLRYLIIPFAIALSPLLCLHVIWYVWDICHLARCFVISSFPFSSLHMFIISPCPSTILSQCVIRSIVISCVISWCPMLSHFTLCSLTISLLSHCILCFLIGYLVMSSYCLVPSYNLCYVLISCVMSLHPLLSHDILCYIITHFDLTFGILLSRLLLSPYVLDYRLLSHYIRCYLIISLLTHCILWHLRISLGTSWYHITCRVSV